MSVCIALLASAKKELVCITDKKVSFPGFSSDYATIKNEPGVGGCAVLCAGEDMEYAPLVIAAAKRALNGKNQPHPEDVADAIDDAYHEQVADLIEKRILRRLGFTTSTFLKSGKRLTTESVYNRLIERISQVKISMRFLVCGFDGDGNGHIFKAGGDGGVASFDQVGGWAIGEGADMALAALGFHSTHRDISLPWSDLDRVLTVGLSAKFMAESANSVGQGTFVTIFKNQCDVRFVSEGAVNTLRKEWLHDGAPKLSKRLLKIAPEFVVKMGDKPKTREEVLRLLDAQIGRPGWSAK